MYISNDLFIIGPYMYGVVVRNLNLSIGYDDKYGKPYNDLLLNYDEGNFYFIFQPLPKF